MKKFIKSKAFAFLVLGIACIITAIGTTYAAVHFLDLPISLPFRPVQQLDVSIPQPTKTIMEQWSNRVIYEPKTEYTTVEDILELIGDEVEDVSEVDFFQKFDYIDGVTFEEYCRNNTKVLEGDFGKLFIDKADKAGTPTGIKTKQGDDLLTLDVMDGIGIVGIKIDKKSYDAKAKLAIINNKDQLDMSFVRDLSYWEEAEGHADYEGAILAVNASNYIWNQSGNYATLFGGAAHNGEIVKRASTKKNIITISKKGTVKIGGNLDKAYNAFEAMEVLIKDGKTVYDGSSGRSAFTAIGTTEDGRTLLLVVEGGAYGSKLGGTYKDAAKILKDYGATDAAVLSGGTRSIMYWNGRVITEHAGYPKDGVKLPNVILVKAAAAVDEGLDDKAEAADKADTGKAETTEKVDKADTGNNGTN